MVDGKAVMWAENKMGRVQRHLLGRELVGKRLEEVIVGGVGWV